MRFGERLMLFFFRPIYRTFVERLLWWFLAKVKIFFLADMAAQVDSIDRRLREDHQQRWAAIEERLRGAEASNTAQWDAMEQLLLALFRAAGIIELWNSDWKFSAPQHTPISRPAELNGVAWTPVIYADLRCLQDPNYRVRGIGHHVAALLRTREQSAVLELEDSRPY